MKKFLTLILSLALTVSLWGCSGNAPTTNTTQPSGHTASTGKSTDSSNSIEISTPTAPSDTPACTHEMEPAGSQQATCTNSGWSAVVCIYCGLRTESAIPALGHRFSEALCTQAKICSVCGVTEGTALGHHYVDGTCSRCDAPMPGTGDSPSGCDHNYRLSSQKSPTCTEPGSFTYTCYTCGESYTEPVDAQGHHYSAPTCTEPGICSACSATSGEPHGHEYGSDYYCKHCGAVDPNKPTVFTVTVRTDKGKSVANVTVTVYAEESDQPAGTAKTGSNGKAIIPMDKSSRYTVILSDIPVGLQAKDRYSFGSMTTNITLKTVPVYDPLDHSRAEYQVGKVMCDFTAVDTDGRSHTLSELLKHKRIVVLNFWYVACNPCKAEFPYFDSFYQKYKDDVELLAFSPYDTEEKIAALKEEMNLSFPTLKDDLNLNLGFSVTAYPTTVVITNDGIIRTIKVNGFKSEQELLDCLDNYL